MIRKAMLILSLVLLALSSAAWMRSFSRLDLLVWTKRGARIELVGHRGRVGFEFREANFPADHPFGLSHQSVPANRGIVRPGAAYDVSWRPGAKFGEAGPTILKVVLPFWLPTAVFATCPLLGWLSHRRRLRRRHDSGRCRMCGYNLTGNLTGVCPECGRPVDKSVISEATGRSR